MSFDSFLREDGWIQRGTLSLPGREAETVDSQTLPVRDLTKSWLRDRYPMLYQHQASAIRAAARQENVLLATGTASGKTLAFHVVALEHLQADPTARVLAIYPLRALASEQEERWHDAMRQSGVGVTVGRIDGSVPVRSRGKILRTCRVITMTPDVIHAWLLSSLTDRSVQRFLKNLRLIIIDEVHNYSGVFGSNSALMYRRLRHALQLLKSPHRFLMASATVADPDEHVSRLIGVDCSVVDPSEDTSPRYPVEIVLLEPPGSSDLLSEVSRLLDRLALNEHQSRFIAFVDSRKQTEQISSILARDTDYGGQGSDDPDDDDGTERIDFQKLQTNNVLPYRSGYEERDRRRIQQALANRQLAGVVSTSALELGIDIPGINAGVLVGVPRTATSLLQRIGRVGRHEPGRVFILNTGSLYDNEMFSNPTAVLARPLERSALYLENQRVQYIHALCLARLGGEHDQLASAAGTVGEFSSSIAWPDGFLELCEFERVGNVPGDLQSMKAESGDDPNHSFPLRDVESQFKVEYRRGPESYSLGSLSYSQLLREAYPGGVYYYITRPFRVTQIRMLQRLVRVRRERRYTTRPVMLPTLLFPNLSAGSLHRSANAGELFLAECEFQVRESVSGYRERRGPNEFAVQYPIDPEHGIRFNLPRFTRSFFTSGTVMAHPVLDAVGVQPQVIAHFIYEAFLMVLPLDRQDVGVASDRYRGTGGRIEEGSSFISIYDQTYGSLRLSGRILDEDILSRALERAGELAARWDSVEIGRETCDVHPETTDALLEIAKNVYRSPVVWAGAAQAARRDRETGLRVICPGSVGANTLRNNEDFRVDAVFFHPQSGELRYRGKNESTADHIDIVPVNAVLAISGVSKTGVYDVESGEVVPD